MSAEIKRRLLVQQIAPFIPGSTIIPGDGTAPGREEGAALKDRCVLLFVG